MNKFILFFILFPSNRSVLHNSEFKVTVNSDISGPLMLFSILRNDTLQIESKNDSIFYIKKEYFGNKLLIKLDNALFDIGNLDSIAKSIHINYTRSVENGCFVVNKIYNDVLQSQFNGELKCPKFNEIYIYNLIDPIKDNPPIIIRRKEE